MESPLHVDHHHRYLMLVNCCFVLFRRANCMTIVMATGLAVRLGCRSNPSSVILYAIQNL